MARIEKGIIHTRYTTWIARVLIGTVFCFNVQCAVSFICFPSGYVSAFELQGLPGEIMVQALGILFLMWNVPYLFALIDPRQHRSCLYASNIMQCIGLVGETSLFLSLPEQHPALANTALRFILFDSFGLLALLAATWLTRKPAHNYRKP